MELYIRTIAKEGAGPDSHQPGDVVAMCDDGWEWGTAEVASEQHVILRVPGATPRNWMMLTAQHRDGEQRRAIRVASAGLPNPCTEAELRLALVEV